MKVRKLSIEVVFFTLFMQKVVFKKDKQNDTIELSE